MLESRNNDEGKALQPEPSSRRLNTTQPANPCFHKYKTGQNEHGVHTTGILGTIRYCVSIL